MSTPRSAPIGAPPPRNPGLNLGEPPKHHETKNNIMGGQFKQLNVKVPKADHHSIRMAAMSMDLDMIDYILLIHSFYQKNKGA